MCVTLLLQNGANVLQRDYKDRNCLMIAIQNHHKYECDYSLHNMSYVREGWLLTEYSLLFMSAPYLKQPLPDCSHLLILA